MNAALSVRGASVPPLKFISDRPPRLTMAYGRNRPPASRVGCEHALRPPIRICPPVLLLLFVVQVIVPAISAMLVAVLLAVAVFVDASRMFAPVAENVMTAHWRAQSKLCRLAQSMTGGPRHSSD